MYIEGPLKSGKTSLLINQFIKLIESGAKSSEILVICANSFKQKIFIKAVKKNLPENNAMTLLNLNIYTFNGIVYNSILNNWPKIEELIPEKYGKSEILPNLCGLDITEFILKLCINEINNKKQVDLTFRDYFSDINLIHQLLRRYRLITENFLDTSEVKEKSIMLNQQFSNQTHQALERLKIKTHSLRSFDYLKQTNTFLYLIKNNLIDDFKNINYLFVDDVDELSYAAQFFIKYLVSDVKEVFFAADPDGGAREDIYAQIHKA